MRSLYRKYRPLSLADVVGQEQITKPLKNALDSGHISHAYLFTGPRGTGKTSVARIFAHEVNGFDYKLEDDFVDIIEIDGASNRGVDNIREIREKAGIKPSLGKYKVYIIDEVHMLTKEAFNALLKTLEEPPSHVIFIMATTDAHKVPVTITSRAQVYNFKLASFDIVFAHLKKIANQEKIKIDDDALSIIVKRGGGSFRDSISLLDQISTLSDSLITKEMVEKAMGLPEDEKIHALLDEYIEGNVVKITALLKELFERGTRAEIIASELITAIIDNPKQELLPLLTILPDVKEPFSNARLTAGMLNGLKPTTTVAPAMSTTAQIEPKPTKFAPSKSESTKPELKTSKFQKFLQERAKARNASGNLKNDATSAKISGIMGGEVQEYGGGNPF